METPLVIEFSQGSRVRRVPTVPETGPVSASHDPLPETFIDFADGSSVPIPTDQLVFDDRKKGSVRIGIGGMSYEGIEEGHMVFWRVRDLLPEDFISVHSEEKLRLAVDRVRCVFVQGNQVWPRDTR